MLVISNYREIKLPKLGERFEIQKGNRRAVYKIIRSINFEGCFDLLSCTNMGYSCGTYVWRDKHLTGCGSIRGCVEQAYSIT